MVMYHFKILFNAYNKTNARSNLSSFILEECKEKKFIIMTVKARGAGSIMLWKGKGVYSERNIFQRLYDMPKAPSENHYPSPKKVGDAIVVI